MGLTVNLDEITTYLDLDLLTCDYCDIIADYRFLTSRGTWANGCKSHYRAHRKDSKEINIERL